MPATRSTKPRLSNVRTACEMSAFWFLPFYIMCMYKQNKKNLSTHEIPCNKCTWRKIRCFRLCSLFFLFVFVYFVLNFVAAKKNASIKYLPPKSVPQIIGRKDATQQRRKETIRFLRPKSIVGQTKNSLGSQVMCIASFSLPVSARLHIVFVLLLILLSIYETN